MARDSDRPSRGVLRTRTGRLQHLLDQHVQMGAEALDGLLGETTVVAVRLRCGAAPGGGLVIAVGHA